MDTVSIPFRSIEYASEVVVLFARYLILYLLFNKTVRQFEFQNQTSFRHASSDNVLAYQFSAKSD